MALVNYQILVYVILDTWVINVTFMFVMVNYQMIPLFAALKEIVLEKNNAIVIQTIQELIANFIFVIKNHQMIVQFVILMDPVLPLKHAIVLVGTLANIVMISPALTEIRALAMDPALVQITAVVYQNMMGQIVHTQFVMASALLTKSKFVLVMENVMHLTFADAQ